jgi:hypothetical protein
MTAAISNNLICAMRKAAETQDLAELYKEQVDPNLFNEKTDYDRDATGLFFDLDNQKFLFIPEVAKSNGMHEDFEKFAIIKLVAYVNAGDALFKSLEQIIDEYKETNHIY